MADNKHNNPRPQRGHGPGGQMMGAPQKAKDFKGTLKRLLSYLAPQKVTFIIVFFMAIGSTAFSIIGPKILGKATTVISEGVFAGMQNSDSSIPYTSFFDFEAVFRILFGLLILYIVSSLLNFVMGYVMSSVSQKTVYQLRKDVKNKLDKLPLSYFDSRTHGEILSRVTNDMDTIAGTLQQSLTQLLTSVVTVIGILIIMLSISPLMTLIALITLPLSAFITIKITKTSQKYYKNQQKYIGMISGHVEEMYSGHKAVKVFNYEDAAIKKFEGINEDLYNVGWKAQFMSGVIYPALSFVSNLGYVLVCVIGGFMVARRTLEIGDIQAFISYMRSFTQPIVQTANIANIIQSTVAAAERVFEVLDEEEEIADKEDYKTIDTVKGVVKFDHVKFGYSEDKILINDMNIDVKSGQTIAIVGPTGAGKTTLINLLMRFYELNDGSISIDGVNIKDMRREDLHAMFGMVLQDTWLYKGTILENIAYAKDSATKEEVVKASKAALSHHFVRTLSDGYDTVLNEEASNISQGQKQLLTIARAILKDPQILILDEATSNVDTRTEILIQKAMDNLMEGRTSFVIAHRLSTIKNADCIIVMNQGSIMEQGTHSDLLEKGGFYADLYNSQFSEEEE